MDFHFLPYELNPDMDEKGELIESYFTRRMGWNEPQLLDYQKSLVETAKNANVTIDFSKRKYYYNTRKAHLLMHLAESVNKQEELNNIFIKAYFKEGLDIHSTSQLGGIGEAIGLDKRNIETALASTKYNKELDKKIERYQVFKIKRIPSFIINNSVFISGPNSVDVYESELSKLIGTTDIERKEVL